jgi:hypothetical protein
MILNEVTVPHIGVLCQVERVRLTLFEDLFAPSLVPPTGNHPFHHCLGLTRTDSLSNLQSPRLLRSTAWSRSAHEVCRFPLDAALCWLSPARARSMFMRLGPGGRYASPIQARKKIPAPQQYHPNAGKDRLSSMATRRRIARTPATAAATSPTISAISGRFPPAGSRPRS